MKSTLKVLFFKLCLVSVFTNSASASTNHDESSKKVYKIPVFDETFLVERGCSLTKQQFNFLTRSDTESNPKLSSKLTQIHLEPVNCFEISINPSKVETKESYTQTDNISTQTDCFQDHKNTNRKNLILTYSLDSKASILDNLKSAKSRSKNLLQIIKNRKKQQTYSPNELIEKLDSMEETTQEEITKKKAFIEESMIKTTNHFEKLKNEALEKLLKVERSLDQKFIKSDLLYTDPNYETQMLEEIARVKSNLKHVVTKEYRFNNKAKDIDAMDIDELIDVSKNPGNKFNCIIKRSLEIITKNEANQEKLEILYGTLSRYYALNRNVMTPQCKRILNTLNDVIQKPKRKFIK